MAAGIPQAVVSVSMEDVEPSEEPKVKKPPNKGLSKHKKGFPVKLSKDQLLMLHMTYLWMKVHGEVDEHVESLVTTLPPYSEGGENPSWRDRKRSKTVRIRGADVPAMITLLKRAHSLPFACSYTFRSRAADLEKLGAMDLMVDAQRE